MNFIFDFEQSALVEMSMMVTAFMIEDLIVNQRARDTVQRNSFFMFLVGVDADTRKEREYCQENNEISDSHSACFVRLMFMNLRMTL